MAKKKIPAKKRMTFEAWKAETDKICLRRTGCSWADLCGDEEPLESAYEAYETPNEFVSWYINKYDLEDLEVSEWGLRRS